MSSFHDTMTALLKSEKAQVLAKNTPLGLVAAVSGGIIGMAVGAPALATTGLGMVLTSLATNLASSLIFDIINPDSDEDTRRMAIQRGLEVRDPQVMILVVDTLTALSPQLAGSLDAAQRPLLLPALSTGMQQAGDLVAKVEPEISAALANPQANWSALHQSVASRITSLDMSVEAGDEARVSGQKQRAEQAAGAVRMSVKASGKSVVENGEQTVIGAGQVSGPASTGVALPNDPQHTRALLAATIARLEVRELQRAQYGIDVPPHVVTELEDLRAEVARLRATVGM